MTIDTRTAAPAPVDNAAPLSSRVLGAFEGRLRSLPVVVVLAVIWIFFYTQNSAYLSSRNITNLTLQIVTTAILALGIVFVLLVGEIDLSSAALSGVAATIAANFAVNHGWHLWLALLLALAVACAAMLVQSAIVVFGVPSLVVTLGGMVVFQGLLLKVLPSTFTVNVGGTTYAKITSTHVPSAVAFILGFAGWVWFSYASWDGRRRAGGSGLQQLRSVLVPVAACGVATFGVIAVLSRNDGGLPLPVLILAILLAGASYITTQTRYGVHLYAVGGDRQAAERAGIPVSRMIVYSFLILGFCATIAGVCDASRLLGVSNSSGGGPLMLNAIAAAVVGGTSLFGGRGSVWAALLGSLVIGSINNGVQLLGYAPAVQDFATGGVLVIAVAIDVVITRGSLRRKRP